jgi:hypothetical protein
MYLLLLAVREVLRRKDNSNMISDMQCWLDFVRGGRNRKYAVSTLSYAFSLSLFAESTYISRVYVVYTYISY